MRARIGDSNRVFSVLTNDSYSNPERILPILKAEIKEVANEYLILNGEIKLRYKMTSDGVVFMAEMPASAVKNMFFL